MPLFKSKTKAPVLKADPLTSHWDVEDPFFFVSHHTDDYPEGNRQQAPPLEEISGRNLGRDYKKIFGFRMYNGKVVPGFPLHAHWGYETVTIVEEGYIDHFDSLGNQGRYGFGDVQWLSAGKKYQHNEMYPLAFSDKRNPNDITQIMIHMAEKDRDSEPKFKMMWKEQIPVVTGEGYSVKVIAGSFDGNDAIEPNDVSWASDKGHHVSILKIKISPGVKFTLPASSATMNRNLYLVSENTVKINETDYNGPIRIKLPGNEKIEFENLDSDGEYWLLEGEPINEKNISFGPVVMRSDKEVRIAMKEVREKEFEDWPWDLIDKAQPVGTERFVRFADGREERP